MAWNAALAVSLMSCVSSWVYLYLYVQITQSTQEAGLFDTLYTEYSQHDMLAAMELLQDLREDIGPEEYPYEYFRLKQEHDDTGKRLDQARRLIIRWYKKVKFLYQKAAIRWEMYGQVLPGAESAEFFIDMLEPLMLADRIGMDRRTSRVFDWYRDVYGLNSTKFTLDKARLTASGRYFPEHL